MADDTAYADLLPALSPLEDPDAAMLDRKATMAKLLGTDGPTAPPSWLDQMKAAQQSAPTETASATPPVPPTAAPDSASPSAAVPAGVTPSGSTTSAPSWADLQRQNVTKGMASLDKGDASLQSVQDQPGLDSQTSALEAQRAKDAATIDPKAAQYKPSFGQRLMRGAEGVLRGGVLTPAAVLGAIDPSAVGGTAYGAPNKQYGLDVQKQQGTVASDDQQLSNAAANWKAANDRAKALATEQRSNADARGKLSTEITGQQNAETSAAKTPIEKETADAQTAEAYNKSPAAKAATTEAEFTAAVKQADTLGLKGTNRTLFLANGKIPDPRQATDDEIATSQATHAFTQENGHPPQTLAEYASVRAAAKGQAGGGSAATGGPLSPAAKAVIEGRSALPPASSRAPGAQQLRAEVFANAPEYDETKYPTYAATRKAFTSGKEGIGINSFNTALHHLDSLESHIPDNTSVPLANWAINLGRKGAGSAALKPFEADALAVSNEVEKAYKGGAITKDEYQHMHDLISENDSPKALKSSIGEFRNLLNGKLQSYQEQWESAMPKGAVSPLQTLRKSGGGSQASADHDIVVNPEDMK